MAKWGEGDPRWIVEQRPDATNVNNWHWTERDASSWSKECINELFAQCKIPHEIVNLEITSVSKSEGEASANNRKGKLIFFYEWNLVLQWEGSLKGSNEDICKGSVTIPNFSEENQINEVDIQITTDDNTEQADVLKEIMRSDGREFIRTKLTEYIKSLKVEFSKGMILPKRDGEIEPDPIKITNLTISTKVRMQPVVCNSESTNKHIDTTVINSKENFQCRAQEFYDVLTKIELVRAFTRSDVKLDLKEGGQFELFGGNISGSFTELTPGKKIVQRWRYKQWPPGHFSTVIISIEEKKDYTEVNIIQKEVPSSEADVTKLNWERYYWNAIKQTFGYGASPP